MTQPKKKAKKVAKKKRLTFYICEDGGVSLKPIGEDTDCCFEMDIDIMKKLGINVNMENKHSGKTVVNAKVTITVDSVEYGIMEGKPIWRKV